VLCVNASLSTCRKAQVKSRVPGNGGVSEVKVFLRYLFRCLPQRFQFYNGDISMASSFRYYK
jgi:hypothetical protein